MRRFVKTTSVEYLFSTTPLPSTKKRVTSSQDLATGSSICTKLTVLDSDSSVITGASVQGRQHFEWS